MEATTGEEVQAPTLMDEGSISRRSKYTARAITVTNIKTIKTYIPHSQTATWYPMNLTDDELDKVAQNDNSLKASIDDIKKRCAAVLSRAQAVLSASQKALAAHPKWLHHAMIYSVADFKWVASLSSLSCLENANLYKHN